MGTTKLNIGKIPISKGEYQEGTAYQRLNQVTMLGSTYQSKIDDNTSAPAQMGADGAVENINTDKWLCIAVGNVSAARKVVYNNETSGLEAGNVQEAIDEVGSKVSDLIRKKADKAYTDVELNKKFNKESVIQESGEAEDKVMSQKAVSMKFTDLQKKIEVEKLKKIPILNPEICKDGSRYIDIENIILDLEIISSSGRNFAPVSFYLSGANNISITFYEVDTDGHYLHTLISFKIDFNTKERTLLYVLDKEVSIDGYTAKVSIAIDSSAMTVDFDAYKPSFVSDSVHGEHWGLISILRMLQNTNTDVATLQNRVSKLYLYGNSLFQNLAETNKFLITNGAQSSSDGYTGYITGYIPVKQGEKYRCFGDFKFTNWGGNFWGYSDTYGNGPVDLGHCMNGTGVTIEIPNNVNYIRMCSKKTEGQVPYIVPYPSIESYFGECVEGLNGSIEGLNGSIEGLHGSIEGLGSQLAGLGSQLAGLGVRNVGNGEKVIYLTTANNTGYIVSNVTSNSFEISTDNSGNSWSYTAPPFTPSGKNYIHVKCKLEDLTPDLEGSSDAVVMWLSDGRSTYNADGCVTVGRFSTEIDYKFDPAYYTVYKNWTKFSIWLSISAGSSGGTKRWRVTDFEVYEVSEGVNGLSGNNAKELFEDVASKLSDINSEIEGLGEVDTELISPSGNKFELSVQDDGTLKALPIIPNKGAFFGNSLLVGSGYGMAASDDLHDYYYLINSYIKSLNSSYTYNKYSSSGFEGITSKDTIEIAVNAVVNNLTGDETLVSIQLGDNVNTTEKNAVFPASSLALCKAVRAKCPNARVVWMGMWYSSDSKYQAIQNACKQTGCKFISYEGLKGSDANSKIGNIQKKSSAQRTISDVTNVVENSSSGSTKNITVTFTVSGSSYTSTLDVSSYSLSGGTLTYTSEYDIITAGGIASHPGDEGFRRISNRFLYEMKLTNDKEYYKKP